MFTGIIQGQGEITAEEGRTYTIQPMFEVGSLAIGTSIACDGICFTVTSQASDGSFTIDVGEETRDRTSAKDWEIGRVLNIEPSLRMGDDLGGTLVSGHVDGTAILLNKDQRGADWDLEFEVCDPDVMAFIPPKGTVMLDGIALTVNEVTENTFKVHIIPHTWDVTTLKDRPTGSELNLEVDMIARYVAQRLDVFEQKNDQPK